MVSLVLLSTSIGTRGILPSKKRKISKKREKEEKGVFFSYLPHGLCRTPRYTEEHCFLVFVLVDPPCWAVLPPPPSKEEGSSLAFCFKKKTKTKKKWGLLEEESIRKSAGKKRLLQKGTPPPFEGQKKTVEDITRSGYKRENKTEICV